MSLAEPTERDARAAAEAIWNLPEVFHLGPYATPPGSPAPKREPQTWGLKLLRRTMDAAKLNRVVNDPTVRPFVGGGTEPLDLTALASDPANVVLEAVYGGFLLQRLAAGLYEAHSMFLPAGRGPAVKDAAIEGFRYLFTATDCVEVVTKVPAGNAPALGLARAVGFRHRFDREQAWPLPDGSQGPCAYYGLTLDDWRARDPVIASWGERFHRQLEQAKDVAGSPLETHPDDEAHDRAVGAAYLMALAGNAAKAVWTYNRWAVFAGYATAQLVSEQPAILDIHDALVTLRGDDLEILQCR